LLPQSVAPNDILSCTYKCNTGAHENFSAHCEAIGYRQNEAEATEQLYREIAPTFVEDKEMVEAQQALLSELGEPLAAEQSSD